jgi:hypothetical protein
LTHDRSHCINSKYLHCSQQHAGFHVGTPILTFLFSLSLSRSLSFSSRLLSAGGLFCSLSVWVARCCFSIRLVWLRLQSTFVEYSCVNACALFDCIETKRERMPVVRRLSSPLSSLDRNVETTSDCSSVSSLLLDYHSLNSLIDSFAFEQTLELYSLMLANCPGNVCGLVAVESRVRQLLHDYADDTSEPTCNLLSIFKQNEFRSLVGAFDLVVQHCEQVTRTEQSLDRPVDVHERQQVGVSLMCETRLELCRVDCSRTCPMSSKSSARRRRRRRRRRLQSMGHDKGTARPSTTPANCSNTMSIGSNSSIWRNIAANHWA